MLTLFAEAAQKTPTTWQDVCWVLAVFGGIATIVVAIGIAERISRS